MPKCSECDCISELCKIVDSKHCMRCTKKICCCITMHRPEKKSHILMFFHHTRTLFAAALGIEILCISAAEIGENSAFYFFFLATIYKELFLDISWDTQQQDLQLS